MRRDRGQRQQEPSFRPVRVSSLVLALSIGVAITSLAAGACHRSHRPASVTSAPEAAVSPAAAEAPAAAIELEPTGIVSPRERCHLSLPGEELYRLVFEAWGPVFEARVLHVDDAGDAYFGGELELPSPGRHVEGFPRRRCSASLTASELASFEAMLEENDFCSMSSSAEGNRLPVPWRLHVCIGYEERKCVVDAPARRWRRDARLRRVLAAASELARTVCERNPPSNGSATPRAGAPIRDQ